MKNILLKIWNGWKKVGLFIGNIISNAFLFIFYFVILIFFAIPYRFFGKALKTKSNNSNFNIKNKTFSKLEDFKKEF
jgi:hypothetical protein